MPIQKMVLFYLQNCPVGKLLAISEKCPIFCKYAVATDDQQLWVMILKNLLYAYESKMFSCVKYPQLTLAAHYLNSRLVVNNLQLDDQTLHFLFLFIPSYILNNYFDIFLRELSETKSFNTDFYSVSCENADRYSNWLLAGMHYYVRDCNKPTHCQPLVALLGYLPKYFSAFHALTKDDITTLVSIIQMVPTSGKVIQSLLVEPALTEVMIQLVVVLPVLMAEEYWKQIMENYPKDSKVIGNTILVRMFEMNKIVQ